MKKRPALVAVPLTLALVLMADVLRANEVFLSEQHDFVVRSVVSGLNRPWALVFMSNDQVLVTERGGRLNRIDLAGGERVVVQGVPGVAAKGQGGLLDLALHPGFDSNRMVYLSFAAAGPGGMGTEVARGRLVRDRLENVETIFKALPKSGGGRHFGSRLVFDRAGYLYITLGERGKRPQAQALSTHPGSIVRIHDDGSIPDDNPFVAEPGARPEIFTYGNRNPQGMDLHPETGQLWTHEHGPQGGDEINIVRAGTNYGWPIITFGRNYGTGTRIGEGTHREGMAQPLFHWTPSIAPSGMAFYRGDHFPNWAGDLFVGSLKFGLLVRLRIKDGQVISEERMLNGRYGRIRDVRSGPDGYLYLLTDERDGHVLRLEPAG